MGEDIRVQGSLPAADWIRVALTLQDAVFSTTGQPRGESQSSFCRKFGWWRWGLQDREGTWLSGFDSQALSDGKKVSESVWAPWGLQCRHLLKKISQADSPACFAFGHMVVLASASSHPGPPRPTPTHPHPPLPRPVPGKSNQHQEPST